MQIEQFVMAYHAEQDRLRALLPDDFTSLRPVLRINAELLRWPIWSTTRLQRAAENGAG